MNTGKYVCKFLYAKSRVAPLNSVTIFKLELNSTKVVEGVARDIHKVIFSTFDKPMLLMDSTVVRYKSRNVT